MSQANSNNITVLTANEGNSNTTVNEPTSADYNSNEWNNILGRADEGIQAACARYTISLRDNNKNDLYGVANLVDNTKTRYNSTVNQISRFCAVIGDYESLIIFNLKVRPFIIVLSTSFNI